MDRKGVSGLYIVGAERATGKSAIALAVFELMGRRFGRLGVFRPVAASTDTDQLIALLRSRDSAGVPLEPAIGATFEEVHSDRENAVSEIVARYRMLAEQSDGVLAIGTDYMDIGASGEFAFNAEVAANLGLPVLCVVSGVGRSAEEVLAAVDLALETLRGCDCDVEALVANRVAPDVLAEVARRASGREPPTYVLPEVGLLAAPTVADLLHACAGELIGGDPAALGLEASTFVVASMTLPNLLDRLQDGAVVISGADRADVVLGVLVAHASGAPPALSGLMLTGGLRPAPQVQRLIDALGAALPIVLTQESTYEAAHIAGATPGRITPESTRKIRTALRLFDEHVDGTQLLERIAGAHPEVVTPLMFEYELFSRARADRKRIVLAEGTEERVLRAADALLSREVADLTLIGAVDAVRDRARQLQLDVSAATLVDPADPQLRERFALEYAARRAHKGVTVDAALDVIGDVSYFATMMVVLGLADGMVSGAEHTTAATIRPAFELIRARSGVTLISSVFFMCLRDRVLVYGDCAVNPDPSAEQLAEIAISSAATASQFGVEPRVAMLSYSTGDSGRGAGVEKVREATALVHARAPGLPLDGPIQYDAAVDASVARSKLPGSSVAGRATVFIFPDLNTANNTYKAVQRSSGALAIGPILQGLDKPVNDLSRGARVQDIINTIAITAIQAQATGT